MTSEVYVWIHLPGDLEPTLAGRAQVTTAGAQKRGEFVYAKRYLANERALSIDPISLPLREELYATDRLEGRFSVLLDAGPDAWGQRIMEKLHGPQVDYGPLLWLNGDQTGALSFSAAANEPPNEHDAAAAPPTMEELIEAAALFEQNAPLDEHWKRILNGGSDVGGARPKFNLLHDERLWLAKLESQREKGHVINNPKLEASTLWLAQQCGVDTVEFRLETVGAHKVLLVERFDRVKADDGWSRLRYASARTVFEGQPELQRHSYTGTYRRLATDLARWSAAPTADVEQLYRRIVFNAAVSNTDDHELNTGLVGSAEGFRLSPAFDLVPQPNNGRMRHHKLMIGDENTLSSKTNLLSSAQHFRLTPSQAESIIDETVSLVDARWQEALGRQGASAAMIEALAPYFDTSHLDITQAEIEAAQARVREQPGRRPRF